jgi:hypothetical protein
MVKSQPKEYSLHRTTKATKPVISAPIIIKPIKKLNTSINEKFKVSDYDSSVVQSKKPTNSLQKANKPNPNPSPTLPRTKRAKHLTKESSTTCTTGLLNLRQKHALDRKLSVELSDPFEDYKPAIDCPINTVLYDYNRFVRLTFRHKEDTYNVGKIRKIGRRLGIKLTVAQINEHGFRDKAFIAPIKEKLLLKVWGTINKENCVSSVNALKKGYAKSYKYNVCKGNN